MHFIIDRVKESFHRDLAADPVTHAWVLNLYRAGERYPQRVCDYFQSDFAPTVELAELLLQHGRDEEKHTRLFASAIKSLEQPVVEMEMGDVFNEVIRAFTPGTFHIVESDHPDVRRFKLANFLAHAHYLESRVARSFGYHLAGCEKAGRSSVAKVVSSVREDENRHVSYTRAFVFELLPRRQAQQVMDVHRRAEAKANLLFSQRQVQEFLARYADTTPKHRRWLYRVCAFLMEEASDYA